MKTFLFVTSLALYLACAGDANAAISILNCENGSGNALEISGVNANLEAATIQVKGIQCGGVAQMLGTVGTDTPTDPVITINEEIDNETSSPWIGYRIRVSMSKPFTLSTALVLTPSDWAGTISSLNGSQYTEQIDYFGGMPVSVGGLFAFSYKMQFSGSTSYDFTQEMTPIYATAPEPVGYGVLSVIIVIGAFVAQRLAPRKKQES